MAYKKGNLWFVQTYTGKKKKYRTFTNIGAAAKFEKEQRAFKFEQINRDTIRSRAVEFLEDVSYLKSSTRHHIIVVRTVVEIAGDLRPEELRGETIRVICDNWQARYARSTVYQQYSWIRRFLGFLREHHPDMQKNIERFVPRIPMPEPRMQKWEDEEFRVVYAASPPSLKVLLLFEMDCGLRYSEARCMNQRGYDRENRTIRFVQKWNRERVGVPVTARLAEFLDSADGTIYGDMPYVDFFHGYKLSHWTPHTMLTRLRKKLGIVNRNNHDLRRTLGTKIWEETKDLQAVRRSLGHKHLASTHAYIAPYRETELRSLLEKVKVDLKEKTA